MSLPGNPTAEVVLKRFDEQYSKYKFMETNLEQKKKRCVCVRACVYACVRLCMCACMRVRLHVCCVCRLRSQIPDIQKTLDTVMYFKSKKVSCVSATEVAKVMLPPSLPPSLPHSLPPSFLMQGAGDTVDTHFLLSDGVYATAEILPTDTVLLWLGVSSRQHSVSLTSLLSHLSSSITAPPPPLLPRPLSSCPAPLLLPRPLSSCPASSPRALPPGQRHARVPDRGGRGIAATQPQGGSDVSGSGA